MGLFLQGWLLICNGLKYLELGSLAKTGEVNES
jgi:hypothetical protein